MLIFSITGKSTNETESFIPSGSISETTTTSAHREGGSRPNNKRLLMLRFCVVMILQHMFIVQVTLDLVHSLLGRFLRRSQTRVRLGIKLLKAGLVWESLCRLQSRVGSLSSHHWLVSPRNSRNHFSLDPQFTVQRISCSKPHL
jgi:hypothetical protein